MFSGLPGRCERLPTARDRGRGQWTRRRRADTPGAGATVARRDRHATCTGSPPRRMEAHTGPSVRCLHAGCRHRAGRSDDGSSPRAPSGCAARRGRAGRRRGHRDSGRSREPGARGRARRSPRRPARHTTRDAHVGAAAARGGVRARRDARAPSQPLAHRVEPRAHVRPGRRRAALRSERIPVRSHALGVAATHPSGGERRRRPRAPRRRCRATHRRAPRHVVWCG